MFKFLAYSASVMVGQRGFQLKHTPGYIIKKMGIPTKQMQIFLGGDLVKYNLLGISLVRWSRVLPIKTYIYSVKVGLRRFQGHSSVGSVLAQQA